MIKYDFSTYMKRLDVNPEYKNKINEIKSKLEKDSDMLDWYHLNKSIPNDVIEDIVKTSNYIKSNCDVFIVIGVGGSFLGAKSVIELFSPYFMTNKPEIIYLGTTLSSKYITQLIEYIKDKKVIVNVVSKSGSTFETNLSFEYLYNQLLKSYSEEELKDRIIITTDKEVGELKKLANEKGYKSFDFPTNVGGRFSVLTASGLLPIAVAGIDIKKIVDGARATDVNNAFEYAIVRDILYNEGKLVESFTSYEPNTLYFLEWLKQLYAETQGKNKKGILPISSINTRDLHSLGQFYQDGNDILFETVINIKSESNIVIPKYNKTIEEIKNIVVDKVAISHKNNTTYTNLIELDELNEYNIGQLIYFFEIAAAVGGYLLDVNPFDQPGVNEYKKLVIQEMNK